MTELRKGYEGGSGQKQPGLTEKKKEGKRVITENEQNSGNE